MTAALASEKAAKKTLSILKHLRPKPHAVCAHNQIGPNFHVFTKHGTNIQATRLPLDVPPYNTPLK